MTDPANRNESPKDRVDAPEAVNREQDDEPTQAQTLADEAQDNADEEASLQNTAKARGGIDDLNTPDLVDHMKQMTSSGRIDMSAFRGERSDDDEDELGESGVDDDSPRLKG